MKMLKTFAIFLFLVGLINGQTADKRVDDIRKLYDETKLKIAEADKQEQSSVFVVEVKVNERSNPYPAVGVYTSAVKFYYTYGDRELNPYPHRLMKIDVVVKRSATTTNAEFLYNVTGDLVFSSVRIEGSETRETSAYFARRQLIKMEDNDNDVSIKLKAVLETAEALKTESVRLNSLFKASMTEGF